MGRTGCFVVDPSQCVCRSPAHAVGPVVLTVKSAILGTKDRGPRTELLAAREFQIYHVDEAGQRLTEPADDPGTNSDSEHSESAS